MTIGLQNNTIKYLVLITTQLKISQKKLHKIHLKFNKMKTNKESLQSLRLNKIQKIH